MQQGHAARQVEARLARVTRVQIPRWSNGFVVRLVRVSEDDHVRRLAFDPALKRLVWLADIDDVMQEEFAPAQFDHLGFADVESGVGIAQDGRDRRDAFKGENDGRAPDVAGVQDVFDTLEQAGDAWVEKVVRVRNEAEEHFQ